MTDAPVRPRPAGARRWAPAAAWALVIVTLTSWPSPPVPNVGNGDKVVHAALYGTLAWLVVRALEPAPTTARRVTELLLVVAAVSAFGWADEWHQQFIPGRSRDTRDWLADTIGATAATILGALRPARRLA